jgi:ABC-type Fe3+-siderophore transport system permease subunit
MSMLRKFSTRINLNKNSKSYNATVIALLVLLLLFGVFLSISIGSTRISLSEIIRAMQQGDNTSTTYRIISYVSSPSIGTCEEQTLKILSISPLSNTSCGVS